MAYFSRRNEYVTEYSGHEEVSDALRARILLVLNKYVGRNGYSPVHRVSRPLVEPGTFQREVQKEFPNNDPNTLINNGLFHEVFTVVEIFLALARFAAYPTQADSLSEMNQSFSLSGSVYEVNDSRNIVLKIDKDTAEKIDSVKVILAPYEEFSSRFFQAAGNLFGRKAKPEDIVKDIFVASEGYLKAVTGATSFGDAIKEMFKNNVINKEQKKVLEALYGFRSDAEGAGHAGNAAVPTEEDALWFLDIIVAQLRMIDKKYKN